MSRVNLNFQYSRADVEAAVKRLIERDLIKTRLDEQGRTVLVAKQTASDPSEQCSSEQIEAELNAVHLLLDRRAASKKK
jgi:DNA-binding MarR family transcriptional regulator